jgi:LemA protein
MVWIVILVIVALLVIALITLYNRFVRFRNRVDNAWAQIEVQLKRRWDLIPNLVETVKGYAAHERGTFEAVVEARNAAVSASGVADKAQAENMLTGALRQLFALAEAYPDLKANQNFLQLQNQLAEVEDNIQMARRYYNGAVRNLNISIQSFPDVIVARMLGFREEPFFELESRAEAAAPQIGFPGGKA